MKSYERGNHPYIFLVEDDIDDQELLKEAIYSLNQSIDIRTVNNGKKAINILENIDPAHNPCLIIIDYNLPELSGAQVLEHMNKMKQFDGVAKIVWSTSNSPVYEQLCLDLGAKAYIVKPNSLSGINQLAERVLEMCGIRKEVTRN